MPEDLCENGGNVEGFLLENSSFKIHNREKHAFKAWADSPCSILPAPSSHEQTRSSFIPFRFATQFYDSFFKEDTIHSSETSFIEAAVNNLDEPFSKKALLRPFS